MVKRIKHFSDEQMAYQMTISIQLRIIRDNTNSLKDEIFTVTKGLHDDWRINHQSHFTQTNSTLFVKSHYLVVQYLVQVFDMVRLDSEKYTFIQLDAPCYPVVMMPRESVLNNTETISGLMRVVDLVLTNWPTSCTAWSP